jgi:hypothetical protein
VFVALVASSATCRNLVARVDALWALVVPGGPDPVEESALVKAWVSCACAADGEIPSSAATWVASESASCPTTVSSEVPRSSWLLMRATRSSSAVPDASAAAVASVWAPVVDASELSSCVLKSAASSSSFADESVVPPVDPVVFPRFRRIAMGFRVSPPFRRGVRIR